jgi:hypothetical protein
VQQSGRAGRDGKPALSIILGTENPLPTTYGRESKVQYPFYSSLQVLVVTVVVVVVLESLVMVVVLLIIGDVNVGGSQNGSDGSSGRWWEERLEEP